jgi:hypothetical protein
MSLSTKSEIDVIRSADPTPPIASTTGCSPSTEQIPGIRQGRRGDIEQGLQTSEFVHPLKEGQLSDEFVPLPSWCDTGPYSLHPEERGRIEPVVVTLVRAVPVHIERHDLIRVPIFEVIVRPEVGPERPPERSITTNIV